MKLTEMRLRETDGVIKLRDEGKQMDFQGNIIAEKTSTVEGEELGRILWGPVLA